MQEIPESAAEWRGTISATVVDLTRRVGHHDDDIRELRMGANAATVELSRLGQSVEGLRLDITRALTDQAQQRRDEFTTLQSAVTDSKLTPKERMTLVLMPLVVAFIGGLVVLFATHVL